MPTYKKRKLDSRSIARFIRKEHVSLEFLSTSLLHPISYVLSLMTNTPYFTDNREQERGVGRKFGLSLHELDAINDGFLEWRINNHSLRYYKVGLNIAHILQGNK